MEEHPRSGQPPKVTAALEAKITSLAGSEAPVGAARRTLALLNETLAALAYGSVISDETIRKVLKEPAQTLAEANVVHRYPRGRVPGQSERRARCVAPAPPAGAGATHLCFDERPCQLLDQVLGLIPVRLGATRKEHQGYLHKGVCNVLLAYNIDTGQRHLQITATKTNADYARFTDWVVATHYPDVPTIEVGTGQLQHPYLWGFLRAPAR